MLVDQIIHVLQSAFCINVESLIRLKLTYCRNNWNFYIKQWQFERQLINCEESTINDQKVYCVLQLIFGTLSVKQTGLRISKRYILTSYRRMIGTLVIHVERMTIKFTVYVLLDLDEHLAAKWTRTNKHHVFIIFE